MGTESVEARLAQLNQAKALVSVDTSYLPQIILGVLPVLLDPEVELRKWVSDFLLSAFSSFQVSTQEKRDLALQLVGQLSQAMQNETSTAIHKGYIQLATLIYPLIFAYVASNPQAKEPWANITSIKKSILSQWDSTKEGIRVCCIKFAQRVLLCQTNTAKDPRLVQRDDVSLSLVLANHPLLTEMELAAEAAALHDRLCSIMSDTPRDVLLMTACVNCLCGIVKARQALTSKTLQAILACDMTWLQDKSLDAKSAFLGRQFEKTLKLMFTHLLRHNLAGAYGPKLQKYLLDATSQIDEPSKKRSAQENGFASQKRLKTDFDESGTPQPSVLSIPPLPLGVVPLATIFNLANDNTLANFDVMQLPQHLVQQIVLASVIACDYDRLRAAVDSVQSRLLAVQERSLASVTFPAVATEAPDRIRELNKSIADLQDPSDLSTTRVQELQDFLLARVLSSFSTASRVTQAANVYANLSRSLGTSWDRDTAAAVLVRLTSRLGARSDSKETDDAKQLHSARQYLFNYIVSTFRENIDICCMWLNEEWYNDDIVSTSSTTTTEDSVYFVYLKKILDAIIPFLESKDRLLMRFLSDLPSLNSSIIDKMKALCLDPDRAQLGYTTLQYLIMLRPPVREACIDLVETLYKEDVTELAQQQKILSRWRPTSLQSGNAFIT